MVELPESELRDLGILDFDKEMLVTLQGYLNETIYTDSGRADIAGQAHKLENLMVQFLPSFLPPSLPPSLSISFPFLTFLPYLIP